MARLQTMPVDPDSPRGREMAERLTNTLADLRLAVAERKRAAERQQAAGAGCGMSTPLALNAPVRSPGPGR